MTDDIAINKDAIIRRCLERIREEYREDPERLDNFTIQDAVVLNLLRACEAAIDLAMHIGLVDQKLPEQSGQRYIVLSYAGELLCFRVDGVDGVVSFDEASIEPPPQDLHGLGREYVFGIGRAANNRMLLLLDLDLAVGELLPGEQ